MGFQLLLVFEKFRSAVPTEILWLRSPLRNPCQKYRGVCVRLPLCMHTAFAYIGAVSRTPHNIFLHGLRNAVIASGWSPGLVARHGRQAWSPGLVARPGRQAWSPGLVARSGRKVWSPGLVARPVQARVGPFSLSL